MRIDLSGGYTGVPQQFLHVAKGRPPRQKVRGKAVPQRVRRNGAFDARQLPVPFQDQPEPLPRQSLSTSVDEQRDPSLFPGPKQLWP